MTIFRQKIYRPTSRNRLLDKRLTQKRKNLETAFRLLFLFIEPISTLTSEVSLALNTVQYEGTKIRIIILKTTQANFVAI